jgi:hypothetical protein
LGADEHATSAAMSRSFYDIDPAGEVLCTYTDGGEKEKLKSVSVDVPGTMHFSVHSWPPHGLFPAPGLFDTALTTMPSAGENRCPTPESSPLRLLACRLSAHRDR